MESAFGVAMLDEAVTLARRLQDGLVEANRLSDPVENLLLVPMIEAAGKLAAGLGQLHAAVLERSRDGASS